jgi:regulatory protein
VSDGPERGDGPPGADGPVRADGSGQPRKPSRPGLSLKGRALKYLAAREHSRMELTRKLAPHAESPEQVQQVLDELEAKDLLSAERFAESVVHRKASRMGVRRLKAELQQHALPAGVAELALAHLADSAGTELQRAHTLWLRRFGTLPQDPKELARQHRFLTARGFSGDVVRQILKGKALDELSD